MPLFADIGNSTMSSDIRGTLGTAVNLRRMENESALSRETMDLKRKEFGLREESHKQDMALSKEQIEAARVANEKKKKEVEYNNTPVEDIETHPALVNNFGPDGAKEIADGLRKNYGKNGVITREQFARGITETFDNAKKMDAVMDLGKKNWERRISVDQEKEDKAQKKFDSDPSEENFKSLEEAKGKLKDSRMGSENFGTIRTTMDKQREMKDSMRWLSTSDPDLYKEVSNAPDVIAAYTNGDFSGFEKAIQTIRTERKALEVARIKADARIRTAKEGMTPNQAAIREEKAKKETNDNYDRERKSVLGKYRLTSEQKEFVERGENPANVKGVSRETADKINKELDAAKLRYDDRYEKKFGERPAGTRRFTQEQQRMYNEYSKTRETILKSKKYKDGTKITAEERNAALNSLDEEARADGLVE